MTQAAGEPVVNRVLEDVGERLLVLLLGLDLFRPEPSTEDVVLPAVAIVEGTRVLAVQVTHAVREVRERRLDEEVVVVAEQAAGVQSPAVAAADTSQELDEDGAIPVVAEDRLVVVSLCGDVVAGAGGEVATRSSHGADRSGAARHETAVSATWCGRVTHVLRARHETPPQPPRPIGT